MIYKVVFRKTGDAGVHVTETKFRNISRVRTDIGNGVTFFGSQQGEVLAFIPNESLLYIEKVEPSEVEYPSSATIASSIAATLFEKNAEQVPVSVKRKIKKKVKKKKGIRKRNICVRQIPGASRREVN